MPGFWGTQKRPVRSSHFQAQCPSPTRASSQASAQSRVASWFKAMFIEPCPFPALHIVVSEPCTRRLLLSAVYRSEQKLGGATAQAAQPGSNWLGGGGVTGFQPAPSGPALPVAAPRSRLLGFPLSRRAPALISCFQPFPVP